ncbi:acetyl-CoA carboxylase biotin carboxyl carrier protein subunit [Erysipelothrix sp. HDW6C]|uniref:biotin/lipoyl-containing protein n=1 Tax=Erysipelothrix sp. HDW6C TaxID=2714930 RepID=UPI00140A7E4F|nr:biotin/lipoyl-containing protein [Erysipelothrix sp. HDW6C]QIK69593.1 acetyl-CoA carboxylase biotin carboxyl carrier protein subunit [Erysipelothrix sp. HDW6C]
MLRKFRVKLNDKEYVVEMEEIGNPEGASFAQPAAPAPVATAAPVQAAAAETPVVAPAPVAAPVNVEGGVEITAPMPGNILDVLVNVGDVVAENQVLLVLEAMKMENNIVATQAGTVVAISAQKGSTIDVGQVMVVIK